ncbi:phage-related tail transmembrane protein [Caballeronia fortuita]|uniref:Phage-related tail transmembrane protein n=1 Tax=Caballeronia fortuita TaxID=1777138 RepID=A0A158E8K8_9BURK|nr:hypothetical protein [Caballeronia fortuita]SAL03083.1 phage-related tail transmembrane protein [Caballeronia fortuita]
MSNKRLNASIIIGGSITSGLKGAFGSTTTALREIGKEIREVAARQRLLGKSISTLRDAGKDVDSLRSKYAQTVTTIDRLRAAQDKLNRSQERYEKMRSVGGKLAGAGVAAGATGLAMGGALSKGIHAAIERENVVAVIRNSGVSKHDADEMIGAAERSKQFGVSVTKATDTVSELRTALGDAHHAIEALPTALKAISGLKLYDRLHHTDLASGDSAYQMAKVAEERGGAADPAAMREKYNWGFKALTGSNGKVTVSDLLTASRTGKAAAQAMSDEAFYGDTFLQQMMGADRYGTSGSTLVNSWIGGHQTHGAFDHMMQLGLLNRSGVKFDKTGKVKTVSPDALIDAQTFLKDPQTWVDRHLIPLAKKRGVDTSDPAQVLAFVNAIASNTNAASMLVNRVLFSSNIWKDRRNVLQAAGYEESDQANQKSTAGKIDNAHARLDDAQERVGRVLTPALASAMERVASALESVNHFADENPRFMKAVVIGIGGLTVGAIAAAPVLTAAGGALTLMAGIKLARTVASLKELEGAANGVSGAAGGAAKGVLGFVGKLGLAAGLAGIALEAAKAAGLPDVDEDQGKKDMAKGDWLAASFHMPAGQFLKARFRNLMGWDKDEMPAPAAKTAGGTTQDNRQYNINFHQQPGQSGKDAALEVSRMLGVPQPRLGSGLYDSGF